MNTKQTNARKRGKKVEPYKFTWQRDRDGYDISADRSRIVRRGGTLETYAPDEMQPSPHRVFAGLLNQVHKNATATAEADPNEFWNLQFPDNESALLAFVRAFGFLRFADGGESGSEPTDYLADQSARFGGLVMFGADDSTFDKEVESFNYWVTPQQMTIRVELDSAGVRRRRVVPQSFIAWMWDRFADDYIKAVVWKECERCGKPIDLRGHYRSVARYCSDICRAAANRDK